ncbi:MAG: NAD(P)H-dependent glycerol-3-phosphate dehydrogenase [Pseudomonadota bacterium]
MPDKAASSVGVIGGGSWGTTLADLLADKGHKVALWVFEKDLAEEMKANRENKTYLPGVKLHSQLDVTCRIEEAARDKEYLVMAAPSHVFRRVVEQVIPLLSPETIITTVSKGIENETLLTMTEILEELLPETRHDDIVVLSGPSFAREVSQKTPTAVTCASKKEATAERVQYLFATSYFRVYRSTDCIGAELGGALKNVIAIAAGIADGLGFGTNTRAALITRGLAEISRLGMKLGAQPLTFAGLAGMGDLVLTCTGDLSRNRTVGLKLGQGLKLAEILEGMKMVAEGVKTTRSAYFLSRKADVEMPIIEQVYEVLYEKKEPIEAVKELMGRDLKEEWE